MKSAHSWFRFYNTTMDNEKVLKLTDAQYRAWTMLLCIASKKGGTIPDDMLSISILLRKPPAKCRDIIQVLISGELLDRVQNGYIPHDWSERQYASDVSTSRVRAHRERNGNGQCNVSETADETPPDTDTDTDTEAEKKESSTPQAASPRGTRWASDQSIPEDWLLFVDGRFKALGRAPPDLQLEAEKFVNFWAAKSGKDATKLDWKKTFLNWCLNARSDKHNPFSKPGFDALREGARRAARLDARQGEGMEAAPDNLVRLALPGDNARSA